jgi:hypothetical protein
MIRRWPRRLSGSIKSILRNVAAHHRMSVPEVLELPNL